MSLKFLLTPKQMRAIEALVTQGPGETLISVCNRAGISRAQMYRYLNDERFSRELQSRISIEFKAARGEAAKALIRVVKDDKHPAFNAAIASLFWKLQGLNDEVVHLTEKPPVNMGNSALDNLSIGTLEELVAAARKLAEEGTALGADISMNDLDIPDDMPESLEAAENRPITDPFD